MSRSTNDTWTSISFVIQTLFHHDKTNNINYDCSTVDLYNNNVLHAIK